MSLALPYRPVVALAGILGHRLVQGTLPGVPFLIRDRYESGMARLEERLSLRIDGVPLLGADHERLDALAGDLARIGERRLIDQRHQPMERVGLALVGSRRQEQQTRRGVRQSAAELMAGYLIGAASQAMRLIDDDQVPARGGQVLEALAVVLCHSLTGPPSASVERLDRVQRADDLIARPPHVVGAGETTERGEVARDERAELLREVSAHLRDPLVDQSLGRHYQRPANHTSQLELAHDQPGFDSLPQAHFVRQQVADEVPARRPRQRLNLMRQRDHRRLDRRQQSILRQRLGDPAGGRHVGEPRLARDPGACRRFEPLRPDPHQRLRSRQPDPAVRIAPQLVRFHHAPCLAVLAAPHPVTRLGHRYAAHCSQPKSISRTSRLGMQRTPARRWNPGGGDLKLDRPRSVPAQSHAAVETASRTP